MKALTPLAVVASLVCAVLVSVSLRGFGAVSQPDPEASVAQAETTKPAPYVHLKRMKLSELVPTEKDAPELYLLLIAIEGEVLLAIDGDQ